MCRDILYKIFYERKGENEMAKFICERLLIVLADSGIEATKEAYAEYWKRPRLVKFKNGVDELIRKEDGYKEMTPLLEEK